MSGRTNLSIEEKTVCFVVFFAFVFWGSFIDALVKILTHTIN